MHFFRVRLILALIASVTLVSVASTYFDVLAHRHVLREDLERRTKWMGRSIQPDIQNALAAGDHSVPAKPGRLVKVGDGRLGSRALRSAWKSHGEQRAARRDHGSYAQYCRQVAAEGHRCGRIRPCRQWQWLEEASPIHDGNDLEGAMAIVVDAGYIRAEGNGSLAAELLAGPGAGDPDCGHHVGHGAVVPYAAR